MKNQVSKFEQFTALKLDDNKQDQVKGGGLPVAYYNGNSGG